MKRKSSLPSGCREYNKRTKRAVLEVIKPGTGGRTRYQRTVTVDRYTDLAAKIADFRHEVLNQLAEVATFSEYVSRWWLSISTRMSPEVEKSNRAALNLHVLPFFGHLKLTAIKTVMIEEFANEMRKKTHRKGRKFSAATINFSLRLLRQILRNAFKREALQRLPEICFEREQPLQNELSPEEQGRLIAAFDDEVGFRKFIEHNRSTGTSSNSPHFSSERNFGGGPRADGLAAGIYFRRFNSAKSLFVGALDTGLAKADLLLLMWRDVDLRGGFIRIRRGKTDVQARIPITVRLHFILAEIEAKQLSTEFVFVTPDGQPYSESTTNRYFLLAKQLAGITRRVRFHDLRHTTGSNLVSEGVSLSLIASVLGHASTRTTERYSRPSEASMNEVKLALERSSRKASKSGAMKTSMKTSTLDARAKRRKSLSYLERAMGFEPTTPSLGSLYSTN